VIIGVAIGLFLLFLAVGGIYKIEGTGVGVSYKMNKLTGTIWLCKVGNCKKLEHID